MFYVYILKTCRDTLYTGFTNNLTKRMKTHESGQGSKYVRANSPFELVYVEKFESKNVAMKREYEIKQLSKQQKLQLIGRSGKWSGQDQSL